MARADTAPARMPRGTGPVTKAFFAALDAVPQAMRPAVAKAAQGAIRDELKRRQEKDRNAARALRVAAHPDAGGIRARAPSRGGRVGKPTSRAPAPAARKTPARRGVARGRGADDLG